MKDLIIEEAESLAMERYGEDFYDLPEATRLVLIEDAVDIVESRLIERDKSLLDEVLTMGV